jgi:hypothetical protein
MNDDVWADTAIAAMLERVRRVCIFEWSLLIAELRRG